MIAENENLPAGPGARGQHEVATALFVDIPGFARLSPSRQSVLSAQLTGLVQKTAAYQRNYVQGTVLCPPGNRGVLLIFLNDITQPFECAREICRTLAAHSEFPVRMSIHSGIIRRAFSDDGSDPVVSNVPTEARQIASCGSAGHILVSRAVADRLLVSPEPAPYWAQWLRDLGMVRTREGQEYALCSLRSEDMGNSAPLGTVAKQATRIPANTPSPLLAPPVGHMGVPAPVYTQTPASLVRPQAFQETVPADSVPANPTATTIYIEDVRPSGLLRTLKFMAVFIWIIALIVGGSWYLAKYMLSSQPVIQEKTTIVRVPMKSKGSKTAFPPPSVVLYERSPEPQPAKGVNIVPKKDPGKLDPPPKDADPTPLKIEVFSATEAKPVENPEEPKTEKFCQFQIRIPTDQPALETDSPYVQLEYNSDADHDFKPLGQQVTVGKMTTFEPMRYIGQKISLKIYVNGIVYWQKNEFDPQNRAAGTVLMSDRLPKGP